MIVRVLFASASLCALGACSRPSKAPARDNRCPEGMAFLVGGPWHVPARALDRDELVERDTTLAPFCMDRTNVTASAYEACVTAGRCTAAGRKALPGAGECNAGVSARTDHPINCVDWTQAAIYCAAQSKRLPDDDELVYATLGLDRGRKFPWGDHEPVLELCWSGVTARTTTCPAKGSPEGMSPEGVADLVGNVMEWTATRKRYQGHDVRAVRGVSFLDADATAIAAIAHNDTASDPAQKIPSLGFRCVQKP